MIRKLSDAAKHHGIQHGTLKQWIRRGYLEATKEGNRWMIEDAELASFLYLKEELAARRSSGRIRTETPSNR